MSTTPKAVDTAANDPLAEALDRLERSMSGGAAAIPPPRKEGQTPKSLLAEGTKPPVTETVHPARPREREERRPKEPQPNVRKSAVAPAKRPAPAPAARPQPAPLPKTEAVSKAVVETWSARESDKNAVVTPRARADVPTWEEVTAKPVPKREQPEPVPARAPAALPKEPPAPRVEKKPEVVVEKPDAEKDKAASSEIEYVSEPEPDVAPVTRRSGNRRAVQGRSGMGKAIALFALLQLLILGIAVFVIWPKLRQGVLDDAGLAAQGGRKASVELNERIGASEERIGALDTEMKSLGREMSVKPADAWKELDYLGERNRLLELGDLAIQEGDRVALDKLRVASLEAADERIRNGARSEVLRVGAAYTTGLRSRSYTLPVGQLFPALRQKSELELGVDQLVKVLLDSAVRSEYRAKAAYLLADHRGGRGADALATAIANDQNLDVVREACLTFCEMTGYRTSDHLDWGAVARWWTTNKARVKAVLGG